MSQSSSRPSSSSSSSPTATGNGHPQLHPKLLPPHPQAPGTDKPGENLEKEPETLLFVSIDTIVSDLNGLSGPFKSKIDPASLDRLWADFARAASLAVTNPTSPQPVSPQLSSEIIRELAGLAIRNCGPKRNPFQSLMWIIDTLRQSDRHDLLPHALRECIARFADRLPITQLLTMVQQLGCFNPLPPSPPPNNPERIDHQQYAENTGFLCTVLLLLARQGRVNDVNHLAAAAEQAGVSIAPKRGLPLWTSKWTKLPSIDSMIRSRSQSNHGLLTLARLVAFSSNKNVDRVLGTLRRDGPNLLTLHECIAVLRASTAAKHASTFEKYWKIASHLVEAAKAGSSGSQSIQGLQAKMFRCLIRHKLEMGGIAAGLACFAQIREAGLELDAKYFNLVINYMFCHDMSNEAMDLFDRMRRHGATPDADTYGIFIYQCSLQGMTLHTFKYYYALQESGLAPSQYLWLALVNAFVTFRDMATAEQCFQDMIDSTDYLPTVEHFNRLMSGFLEQSQEDRVIEYYQIALAWGVCPDASMYRTINIVALSVNQDPDTAFENYRKQFRTLQAQLAQTGGTLPGSPDSIKSTGKARQTFFYYHNLISFFSRDGRHMKVCEDLLQDMISLGLSPLPLLGLIISGHAQAGNMARAMQLLCQFEAGNSVHTHLASDPSDDTNPAHLTAIETPTEPLPVTVYNNLIIGALNHARDLALAERILEKMLRAGHKPRPIVMNVFLAHDYSTGRDLAKRVEILRQLDTPVNLKSLRYLILYYGIALRNFQPAWKLWQQYVYQCGPFTRAAPQDSSIKAQFQQQPQHVSLDLPASTSTYLESDLRLNTRSDKPAQPIEPRIVLLIADICCRERRIEHLRQVYHYTKPILQQEDSASLRAKAAVFLSPEEL